jgi:hypothetical protein
MYPDRYQQYNCIFISLTTNQKNYMKNGRYILKNGSEEWYKDGERHREDGPSTTLSNGYREWRINGDIYNDNGPSVIYSDGTREWRIYPPKIKLDTIFWWWDSYESDVLNSHKIFKFLIQSIREII